MKKNSLRILIIVLLLCTKTHANNMYYFEQAVKDIESMLSGKAPLSFKRAVFLVENAFYEGSLNWEHYNQEIKRISVLLKNMVIAKGVQHYKTGGNWAIFTFMTDSIPENNFCPYQYDYDNFMSDLDHESFMVTKLLDKKKGNCHSLPYLYKILADELGVEACISMVPMHLYVKHRDEQGRWWNLEMTNGTFSRSSFLMETFNVTETAIQSGLYMKSLTDEESVAFCLYDLLNYYEWKTGKISDSFIRKTYTLGLKHYPISLLLLWKMNDIRGRLENAMASEGITYIKEITFEQPKSLEILQELHQMIVYLDQIGYTNLTDEQYEARINDILKHQTKNQ